MLTEFEKAQIRAEEIFRSQVRREIDAGKPQPARTQKVWSWLNSAFGLWLLSSVVLTGLTTAYAHYRDQREREVKKLETEQHLDAEIGGRMFEATRVVAKFKSDINQGNMGQAPQIYGAVVGIFDNSSIYDPKEPQDLSIYPEYQKQNFQSLLIQLSGLGDADRRQLRDAFDQYIRLRDLASKEANATGDEQRYECLKAVSDSEQILNGLMKGRWQPAL